MDSTNRLLYSGIFLDIHIISIFGIHVGEAYASQTSVAATAENVLLDGKVCGDGGTVELTKCRVLVLPLGALKKMLARPPLRIAWKNILLYQSNRGIYLNSSGKLEDARFYTGSYSSDFDEFSEEESALLNPSKPWDGSIYDILKHFFAWINKTFNLFLSSGLRHGAPTPLHGVKLSGEIIRKGESVELARAQTSQPTSSSTSGHDYIAVKIAPEIV